MTIIEKPQARPTRGRPWSKRTEGPAESAGVVRPAPKVRRRPVLIAASGAAVCFGSLLAVWAWNATNTAHEVVAVRATVTRGEVITRDDLMTVQVGVDPGLRTIPGDQLADMLGQRAALDMATGSLVTAEDLTTAVLPAKGRSVVGVALLPSLMPGEPLRAGDKVRVVGTPGQQGDVTAAQQVTISATVVGLHPNADNGQTVVAVDVPTDQAAELAARAATGKVVMVLDSRER